MGLSSTVDLAIVELVIYILLTPLVLFLLIKHRFPGLLGWLYLLVFCGLRLGSDGITIGNRNKPASTTGAILNGVGISPLLLSLAGLLHEPAHYLLTTNPTVTLFTQIFFHVLSVGGVVMAAIGGSKLADPETHGNSWSTDHTLRKAGSCILLLVWVLLCVYAANMYRKIKRQQGNATHALAWRYFVFVALSVPFVGIRAVYGVVYAFDTSKDVNPSTGSFAIKFVLIFLVQLIAVGCFMIGGWLSRDIVKQHKSASSDYQLVPPSSWQQGR